MLGAIIGDIVGSRFEFNPTNDYDFELFTDECSFTDDTICTIAVADAILKGKDYGSSIHEWCRRYPCPMGGYGGSFRNWVMSDNPKPYGSYGNGSAMRVSPIGWWYDDPHDLSRESRKSAECTHSHEEGILGAQAVVDAIRDCRTMRKEKGTDTITRDDILWRGIAHAVMLYYEFPQKFDLNIEDYMNKFNETCQGTVPPALWIILNSHSFEDAIRKAVSLGADADTIGAIVGSIAEALWGIPEWMKKKAMEYLPEEMVAVIKEFRGRLNRLRKLTERCQFYLVGDYRSVKEENMVACRIEKKWAHDLAKTCANAKKVKEEMSQRFPMEQWEAIAEEYDLPISLIGYIAQETLKPTHKSLKVVNQFLAKHYSERKYATAMKKEELKLEQTKIMMFWKLGLGDMNKVITGQDALPDKSKVATADMMDIQPLTEDSGISHVELSLRVSADAMDIIRRGHVPAVMEDHWFMYCDKEYIRYVRSWTGMVAFEAHYLKKGKGYLIDSLTMNRGLAEFGVNGDKAGIALFDYLLTAEVGGDWPRAWEVYLREWDVLREKYKDKN